MAVILNGNKTQKVIAYKGNREPLKVYYRPARSLQPVLQDKVSYVARTASGETSLSYESEYNKNLLNLSIKGNTKQIKSTGKNLIDVEKFAELILSYDTTSGAIVERDGRRCVRFINNKMHNRDFTPCCPTFKANTRYIFSFECLPNAPTESANSLYIGFKPSPNKQIKANETTEFTRVYVVNNANTTVTDIFLSFGSAYVWLIDLDTVYLYEYEGNTNPPYEPYTNRMPAPAPDNPQAVEDSNNIGLSVNSVNYATINTALAANDELSVDYINKRVFVANGTVTLELTGDESWEDQSYGGDYAYSLLLGTKEDINLDFEKQYYCTHFSNEFQGKSPVFKVEEFSNAIYLNFYYVAQTSISEWEIWLRAQYLNGTPVTVQYSKDVLLISDYLEIDETTKTALLNLPTIYGTNVITASATVPPTNITADYAKWGGSIE